MSEDLNKPIEETTTKWKAKGKEDADKKPRNVNHGSRVRKAWEVFKAAAESAHDAGVNVDVSVKDAESGAVVVGLAKDCAVAITASF